MHVAQAVKKTALAHVLAPAQALVIQLVSMDVQQDAKTIVKVIV